MSTPQPNWKDAPGTGLRKSQEARQQRRAVKMQAQAVVDRAARQREKAIRFAVFLRDHRRCRAFGLLLKFESDDLTRRAEAHHLIYRSAGGEFTAENLVNLSRKAHELEHSGLLDITGDPNGVLVFTLYEWAGGTRKLVRTWESQP